MFPQNVFNQFIKQRAPPPFDYIPISNDDQFMTHFHTQTQQLTLIGFFL